MKDLESRLRQIANKLSEKDMEQGGGFSMPQLPPLADLLPGILKDLNSYMRQNLPNLGDHMDTQRVEQIIGYVNKQLGGDKPNMDAVIDLVKEMGLTDTQLNQFMDEIKTYMGVVLRKTLS